MSDTKDDLLDLLVAEWRRENPNLDTSAMPVIGRIMRLGRRFEDDAKTAVKPFKLLYTDFDIIATLRRSGKPYRLTPARLCDAVLLTSGAMTAALDRLEGTSLITRMLDPNDRRIKAAQLTPAGVKRAEQAARARFSVAAEAASKLTARERNQLAALLKKMGSD